MQFCQFEYNKDNGQIQQFISLNFCNKQAGPKLEIKK